MKIAFLGLGEAGSVYARKLAESGAEVSGYDPKLADGSMQTGIHIAADPAKAVKDAALVIALTQEAQAERAAESVRDILKPGQIYLDMNLISPVVKYRIQKALHPVDVVDGTIMKASVKAKRDQTPIYVAGERGEETAALLNELGLNVSFVSKTFGGACALKLIRSIFMKSIEVSLMESAHAAACLGIQDSLLEEIRNTFHHDAYVEHLIHDMITTCPNHARRHGEEMEESVELLAQLGIDNTISRAIRSKFLYYAALDVDRELGGVIPERINDVLTRLPGAKTE